MKRATIVLVSFLAVAATAAAQVVPNGNPVVYAHHHLNVTDVEAQKKIFSGALGGTAVKFGAGEIVKFPGVLVMFRAQKPTGGTKGTTMNHIGFSVPNLRATVDKVSAAGFPIVTQAEVASDVKVKDGIGVAPSGGAATRYDGMSTSAPVASVMVPALVSMVAPAERSRSGALGVRSRYWARSLLGTMSVQRGWSW